MSHDEVTRGYDDEQPRSYGWLVILVVAVLVAAVSLISHHPKNTATVRPPTPSAFPQPSASASAVASAPASASASAPASIDPVARVLAQIGGYVKVAQVCAPLTDGRTTLTVRFLLSNATPLDESLVRITPELPMGGLRPRGSAVQRGTCKAPVGKPVAPGHTALPAGGSVVVSLDFALPKACPAPYPVQAVVTVDIAGATRMDSIALYTDLASVTFDVCTPPA